MSWLPQRPEVLRAFRAGQRAALTAVYWQYVDAVLTLLRLGFVTKGPPPVGVAGLGTGPEQLETAQEVFARAFTERARLSYDGLRPYRPFLLTIAKNLRIDQLRRGRRERPMSDFEASDLNVDDLIEGRADLPMGSLPPPEDLDFKRLREATGRFVATLDDTSKEVVRLRFEQEETQDAVAEKLGISRRRVRTLESRLQSGLKRFLQKEGLR